ncbi:MAG: ribonuclease P protein component [Bacteroidales bacterium]|nr:ribonuclease P protein component [Bacteroidales bacterium]
MRQTFKKHERLHGKTTIDRLFLQGKSFFSHPFIVYYQTVPQTGTSPVCAVVFSVGKKKFPHATQRNQLKRKMREAFRKNKHQLYPFATSQQCNLHLAFIYVKTEMLRYATLEKKMLTTFEHIINSHHLC